MAHELVGLYDDAMDAPPRLAGPRRARSVRGLRDGKPPNPDVVVSEDYDRTGKQVLDDLVEVLDQSHGLMLWAAIPLAEEQKARQSLTLPGKELPEVGIGRDENTLLSTGRGQHPIVGFASEATIRDVDDVVPGGLKEWCQANAEALVEQELHAEVRRGT